MGYQGVAEKDVMDVLTDVRRRFSIDEDRMYLTGLSMGGGGTLWIGLTRPDLWAAIAPVCPAPPKGTSDFAPNALHVPVHIFQGGADPVVPPEGARQWVAQFDSLGTKIEYTEYPGVEHDSWVNAYAGGQIFDWFDQFRRDPYPNRVRFASDRYAYNTAYWVRFDALLPGRPAHIDAEFKATNQLEITTDALDGFTLHPNGHPRFNPDQQVAVQIDGQRLEVPAAVAIPFSRQDGVWAPVAYAAAPGAKQPGLEGPMREVISSRHIYVYGTAGDPTEEELAVRRKIAERAAEWSVYRGPFWGRVMVFPRVTADWGIRPSDLKDANLVLFGTPQTNTLIAQYKDSLPMHLDEAAASDYGLVYVFPLGSNYVLVNEGRPWWDNPETSEPSSRFANLVPTTQLMNRQDYWLFNATEGYVVGEGRFSHTWRLPEGQASQLEASGVVVFKDDAIGAGEGVEDSLFHESRPAMGTTVEIFLYSPTRDRAVELFEAAFEEIARVEAALSTYRSTSEISRINAMAFQRPVVTDPEVFGLIVQALEYGRRSGGAFDVTVGPLVKAWGFFRGDGHYPSADALSEARGKVGWQHVAVDSTRRSIGFFTPGLELDMGGIGKGFALDCAARILRRHGVDSALLGAGQSSYLAIGAPPDARGWPIAVPNPYDPEQALSTIQLRDQSLSTSGSNQQYFEVNGRRYSHIIDPRTGEPVTGMVQVTVISPTATDSDAVSTALFVLGREHAAVLIEGMEGMAALLVTEDGGEEQTVAIQWTEPYTSWSN
jgi:thiamine biosynthesis lipoprotein ApbE